MAVPYFFIASGFFLGKHMSDDFADPGNETEIKKFLNRMFKLYLIWTTIYFPLSVYGYMNGWVIGEFDFLKAAKSFILYSLFVGEHFNSWPLWYLLSSLYTALLLFGLYKNRKASNLGFVKCAVYFSTLSFLLNTLINAENTTFIEGVVRDIVLSSIRSGRIFLGAVYIPLGILAAKVEIERKNYARMMVLGITLAVCLKSSQFLSGYATILSSFGLFGLSTYMALPERMNCIADKGRQIGVWMYFLHMYIYTFVYMTVYHGNATRGFRPFIYTALFTFLMAILLDFLLPKKWKQILM